MIIIITIISLSRGGGRHTNIICYNEYNNIIVQYNN